MHQVWLFVMTEADLKESEGRPFKLLIPLRRLDESSETGLPDLQHKQWSWDTLQRDDRYTSAHVCTPTQKTSLGFSSVVEEITCILLIIMSCSTSGCVSPVRFMVPSSIMKAWTDGKEVCTGRSHWRDNIWGILPKTIRWDDKVEKKMLPDIWTCWQEIMKLYRTEKIMVLFW